ncbi:MAG: cytidyltransferase [Nitrosopumilales archaeon CG11_big_fil_rev_8_21_14_0_20_33_24]|nr:MAG: cytidyltransferase [Nitrosopumilales archaeon CG11_big_fil_rev_8_21_14_0_20_33_24]PIY89619.1 MAG: cytidyltransferase [Nitrosopumilales archaeon CG_4_10_14_0_8_um_filter_34_8]PJB97784.1 MAG: cytidyltransferase [Nitrosopumilales archaeon CG_4_9_14_0_8_um_filter_34_10]
MSQFTLVAMGGTFDIIHKGHLTLLAKAFSISSNVIIGLTSDELAEKRGKKTLNDYKKRFETLMNIIKTNFPNHLFQISKLDNDFGPAVLEENVQALVVSGETGNQGEILNQLRKEKNLTPVKIVIVPMVLAHDGNRISTTRIKNSEIDIDGNVSSID